MTFDIGNPGPGLGQVQKCGRTHVYKQKIQKICQFTSTQKTIYNF